MPFKPSEYEQSLNDILSYLCFDKKEQKVNYTEFTNHFAPVHHANIYTLINVLKEAGYVDDYLTIYLVQEIWVTPSGAAFIKNGGYTGISKSKYEKEQVEQADKKKNYRLNIIIAILMVIGLLLAYYLQKCK